MNSYAPYHVLWGLTDPSGMHPGTWLKENIIDPVGNGLSAAADTAGNGIRATGEKAAELAGDARDLAVETKQAVGEAADAVGDAANQYGEDFVDGFHGVVGHHFLDDVNASTDQTGQITDAAVDGYIQGGYGVGSAFTGGFFDGDYGYLGWDKEVREWLENEGYGDDNCPKAYGTGQNAGRVIITIWTLKGASSVARSRLGFRIEYGPFKLNGQMVRKLHFHLGTRLGLPKHHLPWQMSQWLKNLKSVRCAGFKGKLPPKSILLIFLLDDDSSANTSEEVHDD